MSMIGNYRRLTPAQLDELRADPSAVPGFLYNADASPEQHLDIDKSWHAIHFLLTGSAWKGPTPLRNVVLGGTVLGEADVGYGPARYLTPQEVQKVAAALQDIPPEALVARYDARALISAEIYPQVWEEEELDRAYILYYYRQLVDFFLKAAEAGDAMLVYLN